MLKNVQNLILYTFFLKLKNFILSFSFEIITEFSSKIQILIIFSKDLVVC